MIATALRKTGALGVCALLAVSAIALGAPEADAATTTHCTGGNALAGISGYPFNTVRTSRSLCPGYADGGSPYVFTFDQIAILVTAPPQPYTVPWYNVTATCGTLSEDSAGVLSLGSCTYKAN
ncbi:hypothetical protein [Streptomyces similanensis]|uniref:Secreted protein n=1 Tax=Streptomyces similanensis TaxID=1274988 RepID=A0ABP9KNL8_9ACTN